MNAPAAPLSQIRPARLVIVDDHALISDFLDGNAVLLGVRVLADACHLPGDLHIGLVGLDGEAVVLDFARYDGLGEAANGREAIQLCHRLQPDLVLMDLRMPIMDGVSATRAIKGEYPSTRVIILTIRDSSDYLSEAGEAGADAYLLKEVTHQEIASAIRQVLQGQPVRNQRHP